MNKRAILHELFEQHKSTPFAWDNGGCFFFNGAAALAITGKDPTAEWREKFSTETQAKRCMVSEDCNNLRDIALRWYEEIPVSAARAGDWAVIDSEEGGEGLGVVMGAQIIVHTPAGLGYVDLLRAKSAYRVV